MQTIYASCANGVTPGQQHMIHVWDCCLAPQKRCSQCTNFCTLSFGLGAVCKDHHLPMGNIDSHNGAKPKVIGFLDEQVFTMCLHRCRCQPRPDDFRYMRYPCECPPQGSRCESNGTGSGPQCEAVNMEVMHRDWLQIRADWPGEFRYTQIAGDSQRFQMTSHMLRQATTRKQSLLRRHEFRYMRQVWQLHPPQQGSEHSLHSQTTPKSRFS